MSLGLEVAILPGLAVARRIDCEGDWKRQLLLSPAIGLLICLGIAGISFILSLSLDALTYMLIFANIFAIIAIRVEINPVIKTKTIKRNSWFWIFTIIAVIMAITPLTFMRPMGVDWIGFASLADSISLHTHGIPTCNVSRMLNCGLVLNSRNGKKHTRVSLKIFSSEISFLYGKS